MKDFFNRWWFGTIVIIGVLFVLGITMLPLMIAIVTNSWWWLLLFIITIPLCGSILFDALDQ